jgi:hypothetical protein
MSPDLGLPDPPGFLLADLGAVLDILPKIKNHVLRLLPGGLVAILLVGLSLWLNNFAGAQLPGFDKTPVSGVVLVLTEKAHTLGQDRSRFSGHTPGVV